MLTTVLPRPQLLSPRFRSRADLGRVSADREPYWAGLDIVPVILLAYLFLGVYNNLVAGIYIQKRTELLPAVTMLRCGLNVAANLVLIPPFGLMGAAFATLLSYVVQAAAWR